MTGRFPNNAQTVQSLKRQRRGAAAQVLLSLHQAGQLANPEQWTWEVLDALPGWCLQDEQSRNQLQVMCGALVLAPELRLWIDRELILVAHRLIGKDQFNHIVAQADRTPIAINASAADRFKSIASADALQGSVKTALLQAGASVLNATLTIDVLVALFSEMLGETAGEVSPKLANTLLTQAESLLARSDINTRRVEQPVDAKNATRTIEHGIAASGQKTTAEPVGEVRA